jgi:predicted secreted protein
MIRSVPKGTSAVIANLGRALELALPGGGTTGYRWEARATDGVDIKRLPGQPSISFGGTSCDIFQVTPRCHGDITLQWELRAPWQAEAADIRVVRLKIR